MNLKRLGLAIMLGAVMGWNAIAQDAAAPAANDPRAAMKELVQKARAAGGKMGQLKKKLMKDNADAQAIAKEMRELDQKKRELNAKLDEILAAASPEYKQALEEMKAVQAQLSELKKAHAKKKGAPKKKKAKKDVPPAE